MGDPGASIPTPEPVRYRPMFGARIPATRRLFVSRAALDAGIAARLGLRTPLVAVANTRAIGKRDMVHNHALPRIEVDPETFAVTVDGELATCEPAQVLPMTRRYFLF
jgi:urease subunit alpha